MLENANRQFLLVLLAIIAGLVCVFTLKIPFGPDLKGGTQLLYEVPDDVLEDLKAKENASADVIMDQTITVIRERLDPNGSLDPLITRSGDNGILIELPYFEDKQQLKRVLERISNLGKLEMRIVADDDFEQENVKFNLKNEKTRLEAWLKDPENKAKIADDYGNIALFNEKTPGGPEAFGNLAWYPRLIRPSTDSNLEGMWDRPYSAIPLLEPSVVKAYEDTEWNNGQVPESFQEREAKDRYLVEFIALNMAEIHFTGEDLDPSGVGPTTGNRGGLAVSYQIVGALTSDYADWSAKYTGKCSAIVLNGVIKSAPEFRGKIPGSGIIEGDFTREEVDELVKVLRTGSLRVEPELQSRVSIGPTLGAQAIFNGMISLLAGGVLVFLFMLAYYRVAGIVACVALLLNVFLIGAAMMFMQATITLPGLGGIVLTLGMAVDANVLIYERIREELQKGKELLQAVRAGFERAMSAILDSNITTFLIGIVLFNVGVGPVRGFAVTLMVGIVTTVFTQFFVTRLLFHWALERKKLEGWQPRTLFENRSLDFVGKIKACVAISTIVIIGGLTYAFTQVPKEIMLGMDFTGGANLQMVLVEETTADDIRTRLAGDQAFKQEYPHATVNIVNEDEDDEDLERSAVFNVRLKLNDTQRDEIAAARKEWRKQRDAAEEAGNEPPEAYEPPYVGMLKAVFSDALVKPAFSDPLLTDHVSNENLNFAQLDVHMQSTVAVAEAREELNKTLGQPTITPLPDENAIDARDLRIEWVTQAGTKEWELAGIVQKAIEGLTDKNAKVIQLSDPFPEAQEIQGRLVDDLRNAAIGALILAWVLIVLYLRVRFHEYKYGFAAVIALIHDVLVTFGIVVLCNHLGLVHAEINLAMIACFLTIIGYSVNDSIVVFDRIRENRIDNARNGVVEPFRSLINRSLNQTLSRTVLTTVLTLFVVFAQFGVNYGSESDLESFAFAMIIGMVSGVYSTMYIAAPILIWLDKGIEPEVPKDPEEEAEPDAVPAEQQA